MNMLKRFLAMALVLCMLLSAVPFVALASESGETTGEYADTPADQQAVTAAADSDEFIRAFALDCGRLYFSPDKIKAIIDVMAANDYTHLTLAFGNSGFRFLLDDMTVGSYGSDAVKNAIKAGNTYYTTHDGHDANYGTNSSNPTNECLTQSQMDDIITYADSKGIEIIPALNSPGHMNTIVYAMVQLGIANAGYPVNSSYNSASTINIADADVKTFVSALIQKYITYFAGKGCKYFNLGADEFANDPTDTYKLGFNTTMKADFIAYVNSVATMISDANMTPMMFNDGYAWSDANFNKDIIVCYWTGGTVTSADIAAAGHKVINNSSSYYYVLQEPYGTASSNWCSYAAASNGANNVPVTQMADNRDPGDQLIGAQMWLWCDYTNKVYTEEEENRVKTLIETLAENNPDYFTIPAEPETRSVTLKVGESLTDTIQNYAASGSYVPENPAIANVVAEIRQGDEVMKLVEVTSAADIVSGGKYLIAANNSGKTLTGNSITESGHDVLQLDGTATVDNPNLWTITKDGLSYYFTIGEDSQYLMFDADTSGLTTDRRTGLTLNYSSGHWTLYDNTASDYLTDNHMSGQFANGYSEVDASAYWRIYRLVEEEGPAETEVTFTGLAVGKTTVTIGHVTYDVTVLDDQVTEIRNITVEVRDTKTDTIQDYAAAGSYSPENPAIANVVAEIRQGEGTKSLVEVTTLDQIVSGGKYLIAGASSSKTLTGTVESHPNRAGETVLNIDGEVNKENSNLWTITKDGNTYYFSPGGNGQYLTFDDYNAGLTTDLQNAKISLAAKNGDWTIRDQETSAYLTDNGNSGNYANGWNDWNDSTNVWKIYRLVEEEGPVETEVTFTGLEVGTTTVTIGHILYNITVIEAPEPDEYITIYVGEDSQEYTHAIADTVVREPKASVATMDVTTTTAEGDRVLSASVTSLVSGKQYIIVNTRAGKILTNSSASTNAGAGAGNGLSLNGTTANIASATLWTIEGSNGTYTVKDPNGQYLTISSNSASVNGTAANISIARNGSNWTISQNNAYLNDFGGGGTCAAGWQDSSAANDAGSQWTIYEVSIETIEVDKKVTFTGVAPGHTIAIVGDTVYDITVIEDLTQISLTYHPWISTYPIYPEGTGKAQCTNNPGVPRNVTISAAAEGVNSERGAEIRTLIPLEGDWKFEEDAQTVYWKATVLPNGSHQTGTTNTDHAMDGTDFTYIRYWEGQWSYSSDRENWEPVLDTDEVCAYYLQETNVTTEVDTYVKDWAFTADTVDNDPYNSTAKAISFAVIYPGGTMNPVEDNIYAQSTLIYYDNREDLGFLRFGVDGEYQIEKITYTFGVRDSEDDGEWSSSETLIWEKVTIDGEPWYNETVCWDESYGTEPVVNGADLKDVINRDTWTVNDAILILIYLEPVETEDSLTVVYYDEKFGDVLHSYPINVQKGVTFDNITPTPPEFAENPDRIDVTGLGIVNNLGVTQTFQTVLNKVPAAIGKYNSDLYEYTGSKIMDDGKTLYLYYSLDQEALAPLFVADFGIPLMFELSDIVTEGTTFVESVTVSETTRYGTVVYDEDYEVYIYTPTTVLQGVDVITVSVLFEGSGDIITTNAGVIPASTVYYEESFINFDDRWTLNTVDAPYFQQTEILGAMKYQYGYDPMYVGDAAGSKGTYASTDIMGATGTFTFTGTGFELYANCNGTSGYVSVLNQSGSIVKLYAIDTHTGGDGAATSGQEGEFWSLPVVSVKDLAYGEYTVKVIKTYDNQEIQIDGFRITNTVRDSSVYVDDLEANPQFYQMRDYVLHAMDITDDTSTDYGTLAEMAGQVYAGIKENGTEMPAVILDDEVYEGMTDEDKAQYVQDLLDNGPKNEVYLWPGQTLVFSVETNRAMQIGLKAPKGQARYSISYSSLVDGMPQVTQLPEGELNTSVDMFYRIKLGSEGTHTVVITNTGNNVLSITDLKICDDPNATFVSLSARDIEVALMAMGYRNVESEFDEVIRLAGESRWDTALKVADEMKANLKIEKFDAIIIASGNDFADALAGSYLSTVKNAPILLSWGKGAGFEYLDTNNIKYIQENLSEDGVVYILGGTGAVPELYETELADYEVIRLGGADRFETNLLILEEAGIEAGSEILVCTSTNFADSLSASATGMPILLVFNEYGKLYGKQPEFLAGLKNCTFTVIGGESAVSADLAKAIEAYGKVERLAGANRFETSVLVAQKYFEAPETAVLAYAWNYPDGLCGGSLAYSLKAPLILTMTNFEDAAVEYAKDAGITAGYVLGGDTLISDDAVRVIVAMDVTEEIIVK